MNRVKAIPPYLYKGASNCLAAGNPCKVIKSLK